MQQPHGIPEKPNPCRLNTKSQQQTDAATPWQRRRECSSWRSDLDLASLRFEDDFSISIATPSYILVGGDNCCGRETVSDGGIQAMGEENAR